LNRFTQTHLVGEDTVISSRPEVGQPVESGHLEIFESTVRTDVGGFAREFAEFGSTSVVVRTLPREVWRASTFEVGADGVGSDRVNGVVIFPSRVGVFESFPFAEVFD
jgi:hypothetical protein